MLTPADARGPTDVAVPEPDALTILRDSGSFRDPSGFVFHHGGRVFRAVSTAGAADVRAVRATGLIDRLVAAGRLLPEVDVSQEFAPSVGAEMVLEHPALPFVSYPYEWPFRLLRAAALLHLDIQMAALDAGVALSDATAYNVQFRGARPVFIDHLSFRPYVDGELWAGHRQFCDQFLHPLLLESRAGVPFQPWYRGSIDGIPGAHLVPLLRTRHKIDWKVLVHVVLPARLQNVATRPGVERRVRRGRLSRRAFRGLLTTLREWIARLAPATAGRTTWRDYDETIPASESTAIAHFVADAIADVRPYTVWDLGCNAGRYADVALRAGAGLVVGLDTDPGALDRAATRAQEQQLAFLPLHVDIANPSPSHGWNGIERRGLLERGPADAVLALSLVHHIAIGRNVPLPGVVDLLVRVSGEGVIGFVPPTDGRASALFRGRDLLFEGYTLDNFIAALSRRARILARQNIPGSDRVLLRYSTK